MTQSPTLGRVIMASRRFLDATGRETDVLDAQSSVSQDLNIFGIDVDDYAHILADEFGEVIWEIPWLHYTDQTSSFRGCAVAWVPFWFLGRLVWRALGQVKIIIPVPEPRRFDKRLELGHIAKVIDDGEWSEP